MNTRSGVRNMTSQEYEGHEPGRRGQGTGKWAAEAKNRRSDVKLVVVRQEAG